MTMHNCLVRGALPQQRVVNEMGVSVVLWSSATGPSRDKQR